MTSELRKTMEQILVEIRRRHSVLTRVWEPGTLDRIAKELSRDFGFEEVLVRSLIRDEVSERDVAPPVQNSGETLSDLEMRRVLEESQEK